MSGQSNVVAAAPEPAPAPRVRASAAAEEGASCETPAAAAEAYQDWDPQPIPRGLLVANVIGNVAPFLGLGVGIFGVCRGGLGWSLVAITCVMYVLTALGITVGFHRLFSHRSFQAGPAATLIAGILGSMALQGPLIQWVGMHRLHHKFSDHRGDPHSPHVLGTTALGGLWGFLHAHILWLFEYDVPDYRKYVKDLEANPLVVFIDRLFLFWVLLGLLLPAAIGGWIYGTWFGFWMGLWWGGTFRILLLHQVTYGVNSICHLWGQRSFKSRDDSRDNWLFGLLGFGDGWHNSHHAFPTSARHGLLPGQFDFSFRVIRSLERLGLAHGVRLPSAKEILAKRETVRPRT